MQNFLNGGGEQLKEFGWFRGPNEMFQDVDQITSNNITDQKTKAPTQRMPEPEPPADFRQQKQGEKPAESDAANQQRTAQSSNNDSGSESDEERNRNQPYPGLEALVAEKCIRTQSESQGIEQQDCRSIHECLN